MLLRPPTSTRPNTLLPYTTLFRSLPAIERIGIEFAVCRSKVIGCRLLVVTRLEIVDEVRNLARSAKDPVEAAPAPVNRGLRAPVDERHGFATTRLPRHAADRERMVRQEIGRAHV